MSQTNRALASDRVVNRSNTAGVDLRSSSMGLNLRADALAAQLDVITLLERKVILAGSSIERSTADASDDALFE